MLLMNASDAASAIGGQCGGSAPSQDDPQLVNILKLLTPRVEGACDVLSLTQNTRTDKFRVSGGLTGKFEERTTFRLNNGFVVVGDETPVTITDPDGVVLSGEEGDEGYDEDLEIEVYADLGMVAINKWVRGTYTIEYTAGFEVPELPDPVPPGYDPDARVLIGVPDWMKAIVVTYLTQWYRTVFVSPRGSKEISHAAVSESLNRMVKAAVYGKYQRPRAGCLWTELF